MNYMPRMVLRPYRSGIRFYNQDLLVERLQQEFPDGFSARNGFEFIHSLLGGNFYLYLDGERASSSKKERLLRELVERGLLEDERVGGTERRPVYRYTFPVMTEEL